MTTKDRLKEFLSYKKVGRNKFETKLGLANGYMSSKGVTITSEVIEKACAEFPDLSIDWLITGQGEMLKKASSAPANNQSGNGNINASYQGSFNEPINTVIGNNNFGGIVGNKVHNGNINGNGNNVGIIPADCERKLVRAEAEVDILKRKIKEMEALYKKRAEEADRRHKEEKDVLSKMLEQAISDKDKAIFDKDRAMSMLEKALSK